MALFRSKKSPTGTTSTGTTPTGSTLTIIASGTRVTGDIWSDGVLRIDGILDGSILGARQLVVTAGGRVRGPVRADEIVVGGKIDGDVRAEVRLELQGSAVVNGGIETRAFVVPEGGRVNGDIRMIDDGEWGRTEPLLLQVPTPSPSILQESAPASDSEIEIATVTAITTVDDSAPVEVIATLEETTPVEEAIPAEEPTLGEEVSLIQEVAPVEEVVQADVVAPPGEIAEAAREVPQPERLLSNEGRLSKREKRKLKKKGR